MKFIEEDFVDYVKIFVKGGDGGDGAVAFLREKYNPKGGPAGGDGGDGGNVILVATSKKHTLIDFKYKRHFSAGNGEHGKGQNKHGKNGEDIIIYVPVGTVVKDAETHQTIADLDKDGASCIVAYGGKGGRGNSHFATPTNQAPRIAEKGKKGESRWIILELKLIADVGIIGLPNAGKSTLLKALTRANPRIADYPFTTLSPNLGILVIDNQTRVCLADIPGIIEGAHKGAGLGLKFLRHIERTKLLLHLIDISGDYAGSRISPDKAFKIVMDEMKNYSAELAKKKQIVVGNKIDLLSEPEKSEEIKKWEKYFSEYGLKFYAISAVTREGIHKLIEAILEELQNL